MNREHSVAGMSRRGLLGVGAAVLFGKKPGRTSDARPAILGGEPVRRKPFPSWPQVNELDERNWLQALRECKWWRREGHFVDEFERAWASTLGVNHCIATANGTGALMAALEALEVGPKDEVIVGPYTFIATVNAILARYALPVFVDTDPETMLIDPDKIEAAITPRTRCILPVHIGGNVADMDRILEIAKRRNIPVLEDACQAHLAEWRGRKVGGLGQLGAFSFQKFKNVPGGEGGAVVTNDRQLYLHAYGFHSHYRSPGENAPDLAICRNGINLRMPEFQAALLLAQLTRSEQYARKREANARYLTELLAEIPGIRPARMYPGCTRNAYHMYMMRYEPEHFEGLSREMFIRALRAEGIPVSNGYGPLNRHPFLEHTLNSRMFRSIYTEQELRQWRERNHCPENDRLCEQGLWFSQPVLLAEQSDMEDIALAIQKIRRYAGELARRSSG